MASLTVSPQVGPQTDLLACPAQEIFYGGARGGGKSHGVLLDWVQHYLQHPQWAMGIIFRRTYPELENIIDKCLEMFPAFGGHYIYTRKTWIFPGGASLKLRHLERDSDATRYQGHEYTWVGVDEAGSWPTPSPLWKIKATLRSPHGVPTRMVLTGNPGGAGQPWLKDRYITGYKPYQLIQDEEDPLWYRTYIPAKVWDNKILLEMDPGYVNRLRQVGADWLVKAWLDGDWDVVPGMFLEGVWDASRHVCDPFDIPPEWKRFRALDWGYAAPYSVGWYTIDFDGRLYRYRELYGRGKRMGEGTRENVSQVAQRILDIEADERQRGIKFLYNPADSACWINDGRVRSINDIFTEEAVIWSPSTKGPGSRINSAQEVINRLRNDMFVVFSHCQNFLETVPGIPSDPKMPEDVDTESIDHAWDELRYAVMSRQPKSRQKPKSGKPVADTFDWVTDKDTYKPAPFYPELPQ